MSQSIQIIHVDDEPDYAEMTAEFLEREDDRFEIETATSAAECVRGIKNRPPDCIISDYDMPRKNGIEFLQRVREDYPELPFILFTGKGSEQVASQAISAGVTDYLQKTGGSEQYELLANRIVNAVERRRANKALTTTRTRNRSLRAELIELSIELLQSEHTDIDDRIEQALERIGTHVGADRSYVFQIDRAASTTSNTHEWCADDVTSQIESLQNIPLDTLPWWMEQLEECNTITIPDVSELPTKASATQELLQAQNIRSLIVTPMISGEDLVGFIGFDWLTPQDEWAEEFVDILHITGRLITSTLRQESRRQELERREAYLEQSGDIISVVDGDGDIVYQSPSTEWVTGFSPAEVIGQSAFEYVHPADRETIKTQFSSFVSQPGAERRTEFRIKTRGDSWKWVEVRAINKLDDPNINGVLFSSRDISTRKAREQELEKYETIVNSLGDAVYTLDDAGTFTNVNDAFVDLVEYDRQTILGNSPSLIKDERAVETAEQRLASLLSDDGPDKTTFDVTIHPRDSEPLVCEDHMGVLSFDGDDFKGSVGTLRDVTAHRERINEVEQLNSQYETLVEHFPDGGVFLFDTELQVIRAGGTELTAVGLSRDEIEGKTPHDLFPDEIADEHAQYFQKTLEGERHTYQQKYRGKHYEIRTVPVRESNGEITKGMAVSCDITEEQVRKQELERQNEQLAEFANVVSHDLRNPLHVAEGQLELAQAECDSSHLDTVADAIDRSMALIDDVLTLARGGDTIRDPELVSVSTLATECWDVIPREKATLTVETTQAVSADRSRLRQLLENLLVNAVEHGGESVRVRVGDLSDGFYVADDGVGIPDGAREEIFEAGYSTVEDGTGFGMRIVEQVVDAHGWNIRVTDSDDGGARVEITGVDVLESDSTAQTET